MGRAAAITQGYLEFSGGDAILAAILEKMCVLNTFQIGDALVEQGMAPKFVYILITGQADVSLTSRNGYEVWIETLTGGTLFGELSPLLHFKARQASVIATSRGDMARMTILEFESLLESSPVFSKCVIIIQAKRNFDAGKRLLESQALPISARVHAELMRLATQSETDTRVYIISAPLTVSALAKRVNASRESVSRALSVYEKNGLLEREAKKWTVSALQ